MDYNYTLRYRTFDSLLEDVKLDLRNLSADTSIEPAQLIKIARKCNYDLGLRIQKTKETVLDICKGKARLPDDFQVMNFALICGNYHTFEIPPQGTHIEEVHSLDEILPKYRPWVENKNCTNESNPPQPSCLTTIPTPTCLTKCGQEYILVRYINTTYREYRTFAPIKFRSSQFIDMKNCPNLHWGCKDEAYIKDGWIYTNLDEAELYINYEGDMIDDDGNLIVVDHPMLNEFYEYSMKKRILENLILDNVNLVPQYQMISNELRAARNNAFTIVNTPNFSEMAKVWAMNRKMMYGKYYSMFASYSYPYNPRINNAV